MKIELAEDAFDPRELRALFGVACELEEAQCGAFLDRHCQRQPRLRAEIERLLRADRQADKNSLWRAPAAVAEARNLAVEAHLQHDRVGDYRILRRIGAGGMGAVYLAERDCDGVRQRAAVKIIPSCLLDDEMLWRFRQERQILARLDHPSITRMLDAGRTPDGMPYLAMEFVEGIRIDRYAAEHNLTIHERVKLFRSVCDAVAYAHRNLIVHRDLKPQNVLVTADGAPKLLDFGIAKILAAAEVATRESITRPVAAMTPDYASPEQVRGSAITTACDIYSLGVMLYELLAGRTPYSLAGKPLSEIVSVICEEEPPLPSSFNRRLAGDLDAIVRKAIRKQPEERYASAEELSKDLERYLAGDPVSASGVSLAYLARKYVSRHRPQAVALTAAVILTAAGIGGVAVEAHIANRERAKAQRRFQDLRQLADDMFFKTNEKLAALPGSTEARRTLIARGLEYLNLLAQEAVDEPGLAREVGAAYLRMGDIQGNVSVANLGDSKAALASYQKARQILAAAVAKHPADIESTLSLIDSFNKLSLCYGSLGNTSESQRAMDAAAAAAKAAIESHPQDLRVKKALADAYFYQALSQESAPQAIALWRNCLELYVSLLEAKPRGDRELRNVALIHKYLAETLLKNRQPVAALQEGMLAEQMDTQRLAANPANVEAQLDLTFDLNQTADAYSNTGDAQKALARYSQSLEIRRRLSLSDPSDVRKRLRLAYAENSVGRMQVSLKEFRPAMESYRASAAIGADLLAQYPAQSEIPPVLFRAYEGLGNVADGLGKTDEACGWYRRAVGTYPPTAKYYQARIAKCAPAKK